MSRQLNRLVRICPTSNVIFTKASKILQFRLATQADLPAIVRIHKVAYSRSHFMALLPDKTLVSYYEFFLSGGAEISLAVLGDDVLGFAVYGENLAERIESFKKTAAYDILKTSICNPVIATRKAFNAMLARLVAKQVLKPADFLLLSIAVAQPGCGIGGHLLRIVSLEAKHRCERAVGLYVNADNIKAINAYFAAGFVILQKKNCQFYMEMYLEQ